MTDMVERVGEALRDQCKVEFGSSWSYDVAWRLACAAIEAMREPTPKMVAEGQRIYAYGPTATYVCMIDAVISTHARYRAMIDADLSKPLPSPAIDDMDRK